MFTNITKRVVMKNKILFFLILMGMGLQTIGCSFLWDAPKNVIGVSVKDMEDRLGTSSYQVYDCDKNACFMAVQEIAAANKYHVFLKDEIRGIVVLMHIPGAVDTTEVGVFLTVPDKGQGTKIDISSRSSPAKCEVARTLFSELSSRFNKI